MLQDSSGNPIDIENLSNHHEVLRDLENKMHTGISYLGGSNHLANKYNDVLETSERELNRGF